MSGKMALIKKNQYIVPNHHSPMSGAEINPFHRKMLTFTLRCYMTHESLRGPGPCLALACQPRGSLQWKRFLPWADFLPILILPWVKTKHKKKKTTNEKWNHVAEGWFDFHLVVSHALSWYWNFTSGSVQQAPGDPSVKRGSILRDNFLIHIRNCLWF